MRRYAHYSLDENGKQVVTIEEFPDLDETVEVPATPDTEPVDTEAVIMETLLDQELRISALELGV